MAVHDIATGRASTWADEGYEKMPEDTLRNTLCKRNFRRMDAVMCWQTIVIYKVRPGFVRTVWAWIVTLLVLVWLGFICLRVLVEVWVIKRHERREQIRREDDA